MINHYSKIVGIPPLVILCRSRTAEIALARAIYWWMLHEVGFNYSEIGRLNCRTHTDVRHCILNIEKSISVLDPQVMCLVDKVRLLVEIFKLVKL